MTHLSSLAQTAQKTVEDRSQEFVAVQGGAETTSAGALLVGAYALMWVALLAFIYLTWRRQQRLEARVAALSDIVDKAPDRSAPAP